jgi:SSS family transporter
MQALDWYIVTAYFTLVLLAGIYAGKRAESLFEYFLAGRGLGVWLVVVSVIATETSAATFIGGPDTSYRGNLAYLQTTIGAVLSRVFLAYFFMEAFYRAKVYTVYGYLAERFGLAVQLAAASLFSIARLAASGARLYIASFAVAGIAGVDLYLAILLVGVFAVFYGVLGGLRAVVWTDCVQGFLFLTVGGYALWSILGLCGGWESMYGELAGTDKLQLFDFSLDFTSREFWRNPYTFVAAILGGFTLGLATHGTDQDNVQRLLACRESKDSKRSLLLVALIEIPVAILFVSIGLGLWVYFKQNPALAPSGQESAFPHFIKTVFPLGVRGLVVAAILAAAMSSLDSALNALASVSVHDLWRVREDANPKVLRSARLISLFWGVLLILTAMLLAWYHQQILAQATLSSDTSRSNELLTLALGVMACLYGPLLGVFLVGLFTRRGSCRSVLAGIFCGLLATALLRSAMFFELGWTWHIVVGTLVCVTVSLLGRNDEAASLVLEKPAER